jgi:hypothetical protein
MECQPIKQQHPHRDDRLAHTPHHTMARMNTPMIKTFALAIAALLCFASQGFARHPFHTDPISDTPSVLIRADAPASAAAVVSNEIAPVPMSDGAAAVESSEPIHSQDSTVIESAPVVTSESAPIYRTVRPSRKQNNVFGELMELERKKNAWLRKTFLGR